MADLTITASSVVPAASVAIYSGTAGGTITAGQAVYKDLTDSNKLKACDADVAASAVCAGIALNNASSGQAVHYMSEGDLNPGATVAVGVPYFVSTTAGGICVLGDLATGDYITYLGTGTTTSNISVKIHVSGAAKA